MSDDPDAETYRLRLAEEQNRLARERTILAHIRTGFASFLFGVALFGLFDGIVASAVAAFFVLAGAGFLATGWWSYARSDERARAVLAEMERPFRRR